MADPTDDKQRVSDTLKRLKDLVRQLPGTGVPKAAATGPIATEFSDKRLKTDEGCWFGLNRAYERCFQADPKTTVLGGKHGAAVVYETFKRFSTMPEMEPDLSLLELKILQFIEILRNA